MSAAQCVGLVWEVFASKAHQGAWIVEAIDHHSEGEIYHALFTGPGARQRAHEYAAWKRGQSAESGQA